MTNCFHIVLQECGPSGVPNGQWMKVPRPGKTRDTSIQFLETFPAICNFHAYDCVTSSPTMNILVLFRSQCRCRRILWKKHKRYMEEHRAHQRVFVCMYLLLLCECVIFVFGRLWCCITKWIWLKRCVCFSVSETVLHTNTSGSCSQSKCV